MSDITIPPMDVQTHLPEPIKIRFTGKSRHLAFKRKFDTSYAVDRRRPHSEESAFAGTRCFTRQKTNLVVKTVEEADDLLSHLSEYTYAEGYLNGPMRSAFRRVCDTLDTEMHHLSSPEFIIQCTGSSFNVVDSTKSTLPASAAPQLDTEITLGDTVEIITRNKTRTDGGRVTELGEKTGTRGGYTVKAIHDDEVLLRSSTGRDIWYPTTELSGRDEPDADDPLSIQEQQYQKRQQADMDALLDAVKQHARLVVADTWPGGTVDVDDIDWFWNTRLRSCAGKAYPTTRSAPSDHTGPAIGLAPEYYFKHGLAELLATVRHELIHVWQFEHPDGDSGHGPTFHQWTDDLNTHRHCKHW